MPPPPRFKRSGYRGRGIDHGRGRPVPGRRPPTPAVVQSALTPEIERRIAADPAFAVMSSDRQLWIDPYTGQAVPASLGREAAAREYLLDSGVWRSREPMTLAQVEFERWRHDLARLLPIEARLRIFSRDGRGWCNPFTGELHPEVALEDGRITPQTLARMAQRLATTAEARGGRMLDQQVLLSRVQSSSRNETATGLTRQPQPISDDMVRARSVQQHMLPQLPRLEGWELGAHFGPHAAVSGDFYDIQRLSDGRLLMVIGDVSGHGMQAALVVASAVKTLRLLARQFTDLRTLLSQFNDELKPDLLPGQFLTLCAAALDTESGRLEVLRAGHYSAILAGIDRETPLRRVGSKGMAMGLAGGSTFSASLRPEIVDLGPGDVVMLYTDGAVEAAAPDEELFGEARVFASLLQRLERPSQDIVDGIAADVHAWAKGRVEDDLTLLALGCTAGFTDSSVGEEPIDYDEA